MQLEEISDNHDWRNSSFGPTVQYMKETKFHTWGFLIYRCASYDNDTLWQSYLTHLKANIHEDLVFNGTDKLLEQYAQWTVIDSSELSGATKDQIRTQFSGWRDEHSRSWTLPPFSSDYNNATSTRLPRFTYCLYVDEKCLKTLKPHVDAAEKRAQNGGWGPNPPPLAVVIIDGDFQTSDERSHSDTDNGPSAGYQGWAYYAARYLASFYENAHDEPLSAKDHMRPPSIGPTGRDVVPE